MQEKTNTGTNDVTKRHVSSTLLYWIDDIIGYIDLCITAHLYTHYYIENNATSEHILIFANMAHA